MITPRVLVYASGDRISFFLQQQVPHIRSEQIFAFCKTVADAAGQVPLDAEKLYQEFIPLMLQFDDVAAQLQMTCLHGVAPYCWLIAHIERWNDFITTFGVELVQVSEDKVWLRTLQLDVKKPGNKDDFTVGVCLLEWIITQHHCIERITLQLDVVSSPLAYPLYNALTFHSNYVSVGIQTSVMQPDPRISDIFIAKIRFLCQLQFLQLCGIRVSGTTAVHLSTVLQDNLSLKEFVFTSVVDDVEMTPLLFRALSKHRFL